MSEEKGEIKLTDGQKALIKKAGKLYDNGQYDKALVYFESVSKQNDDLANAFSQCIRFCKNVTDTRLSPEDELYIKTKPLTRYLWCATVILIVLIFKLFSEKEEIRDFSFRDVMLILASIMVVLALRHIYNNFPTGKKIRCKYCSRYINTPHYEDSDCGGSSYRQLVEYNCKFCDRSYPAPSIHWDSFGGQTYIYGRGSVPEKIFYEEFEARNPNYPHSEMADKILRGKKSK
jgi:hypothetical protein